MRRVAGVLPRQVQPVTWVAAVAVALFSAAAALFAANHIVAWNAASIPQGAKIVFEPMQTPNRAAKAAREPLKHAALKREAVKHEALKQEARLDEDEAAPNPEIVTPMPEDDGGKEPPTETGRASWYQLNSKTASGEHMDPGALTAAHPSLPFGTKVKVANLANGRSVVVRINDRGPFAKGRIIDVSKAAAMQLGMVRAGVARVSVSPVIEMMASSAE